MSKASLLAYKQPVIADRPYTDQLINHQKIKGISFSPRPRRRKSVLKRHLLLVHCPIGALGIYTSTTGGSGWIFAAAVTAEAEKTSKD